MKRAIIIGLILVLILAGIAFYRFYQSEKAIEELGEEFTREELLEMVEKQTKSGCKQLVVKLKDESQCLQFRKTEDQDACYYCFALEKNDPSLCEKITKGNFQNCKEQAGQAEPGETEKDEIENTKKKARDNTRKTDMRKIATAQETYYANNNRYLSSPDWPSAIGVFMSKTPTDPGDSTYVWVDNTKDSQKYCAYATLEEGGWFTASHRGNFECSDHTPTLSDCCF